MGNTPSSYTLTADESLRSFKSGFDVSKINSPLNSSIGFLHSEKFNLKDGEEEQPFIKRFALHALRLQFTGLNGEEISVEAPYPKDFRVLVDALRQNQ